MPRYVAQHLPYRRPPETAGGAGRTWPVAIVGAGPVGLAAAVDLALHGVPSVVLDDNDVVATGSRAICWAKRTLEVFDRLGVGRRIVDKGVTWRVGRLFHGTREIYQFDLLPEPGHAMPAFVNLQQYYVEQYLVERCRALDALVELRFKNRVVGLHQQPDHVTLQVETPDGPYLLDARYVLACDGARSPIRAMLGLGFAGEAFEERFLIADVVMEAPFPAERWFWFEPPFHDGQSALLHKQPDDVYRIDLQLGPNADPAEERRAEMVIPRIRAMVGERPFELDWVSVYAFACRRLERFVHGRVLFAGDAAHVVSPFGARGGNGGIQDVDNLCWKLAMVLAGTAPPTLLHTYDEERQLAADENIRHSRQATRFLTPPEGAERLFRDAVLQLAAIAPFARAMVNSGRLSTPCSLAGTSSVTPPTAVSGLAPGEACVDAPIVDDDGAAGWLLPHLGGRFHLLTVGDTEPAAAEDRLGLDEVRIVGPDDDATGGGKVLVDVDGLAAARYGASVTYLIRPDQHVAACFPVRERAGLGAAYARAIGRR